MSVFSRRLQQDAYRYSLDAMVISLKIHAVDVFLLFPGLTQRVCTGIVLPFESSGLRYNDFVTRVPRSALHQLPEVVTSLADSRQRLKRMRSAMENAWMRITWQRALLRRGGNRGLDAFELLLREIANRKR